MSLLYKLIIGACLSLALKTVFVPDWMTIAALFVFATSGLVVYFLERKSTVSEDRVNYLDQSLSQLISDFHKVNDKMTKLENHVERVDNRTRPAGR